MGVFLLPTVPLAAHSGLPIILLMVPIFLYVSQRITVNAFWIRTHGKQFYKLITWSLDRRSSQSHTMNEYQGTRATFLLSAYPPDEIWSTWDSQVTGNNQNSQTCLTEFYFIHKTPIHELHRALKIPRRAFFFFRPQITLGRNHFNYYINGKLNFSECYKIENQESLDDGGGGRAKPIFSNIDTMKHGI